MADPHAHSDHAASDYEHGAMQIEEQISTFRLFIELAKWGSLAIAALLLFLVLWFNPSGNFFTAVIGAVALLAVGGFALKGSKSGH